jgi:hypothetical protein
VGGVSRGGTLWLAAALTTLISPSSTAPAHGAAEITGDVHWIGCKCVRKIGSMREAGAVTTVDEPDDVGRGLFFYSPCYTCYYCLTG